MRTIRQGGPDYVYACLCSFFRSSWVDLVRSVYASHRSSHTADLIVSGRNSRNSPISVPNPVVRGSLPDAHRVMRLDDWNSKRTLQ